MALCGARYEHAVDRTALRAGQVGSSLVSRELRELRVVALLIDGVHFGAHMGLAAVGVAEHGDQHVPGRGCTGLACRLVERGLETNRSFAW